MRILVIETATEACSLALFAGDTLVASHHEVLGRGHAERLVPLIAAMPGKGRADEIRVSLGPGSFTGTRIGIAAARALGLAWGAAVRGYPTLALVACGARASGREGRLTVAMTGGHGEAYVQAFCADGSPDGEARSLTLADAAVRLRDDAPQVIGTMAEPLVAAAGRGHAEAALPDARHGLLLPARLVGDRLAPLYGRPPDAKLPGA